MTIKWHKTLPFPCHYALATEDELREWSTKKKVPFPVIPKDNVGSTLNFGGYFVIVVQKHKKQWDLVDTIIHESVHIHQGILTYVGETLVGDELEAYQIAAIATNLLRDADALSKERCTPV